MPVLRSWMFGVGRSTFADVCIGACLLVVFLAASCAKRESPAEEGIRTKTLLLGNGAEPRDLDPDICNALTDMNILGALFEGLTSMDEKTSQAVPGVAERWDVSTDGLVYRSEEHTSELQSLRHL